MNKLIFVLALAATTTGCSAYHTGQVVRHKMTGQIGVVTSIYSRGSENLRPVHWYNESNNTCSQVDTPTCLIEPYNGPVPWQQTEQLRYRIPTRDILDEHTRPERVSSD